MARWLIELAVEATSQASKRPSQAKAREGRGAEAEAEAVAATAQAQAAAESSFALIESLLPTAEPSTVAHRCDNIPIIDNLYSNVERISFVFTT